MISEFANDAEMGELIEYFLGELQTGIESLRGAWEQGDRDSLYKLAHQLKGAAGGYGFPTITDSAAALESALKTEQFEDACVTEKVEALLALCRRAAGGESDRS